VQFPELARLDAHVDGRNPAPTSADVGIIGGGVIGLAIARQLALQGREVFLIDKERFVGFHTSSRNSEVIHAGIHYPLGSLKARLCVRGRDALYAYCAERGVPHQRTGKLVVATREEELPALEHVRSSAAANGVELGWLDAGEVRALEPEVSAVRGLWSPLTGIVDSHSFMSALREDAEQAGAMVVLGTPVLSGRVRDDGVELSLGGDEPARVSFRLVVNCAGLWAPDVARRLEGFPANTIPPQRYAKAHYFVLSGRSPFRHLVYPVPVPGGLGTHVTLDLAGRARFGPDVQWVDSVDYAFDESRADSFYASIRRWWPGLQDGALQPGYTGIRPKVTGPGEPAGDFLVHGPAVHGIPGLLHLYGIESPGLTAALALADEVAALG
jgi:L-2-hydroxyglutarate oxidase LhgO